MPSTAPLRCLPRNTVMKLLSRCRSQGPLALGLSPVTGSLALHPVICASQSCCFLLPYYIHIVTSASVFGGLTCFVQRITRHRRGQRSHHCLKPFALARALQCCRESQTAPPCSSVIGHVASQWPPVRCQADSVNTVNSSCCHFTLNSVNISWLLFVVVQGWMMSGS